MEVAQRPPWSDPHSWVVSRHPSVPYGRGVTRYRIRVRGVLGWVSRAYFDGFEVAETAGAGGRPSTVLTGEVVDQAALHGVLARIRDLGLELEEVRQLPAG